MDEEDASAAGSSYVTVPEPVPGAPAVQQAAHAAAVQRPGTWVLAPPAAGAAVAAHAPGGGWYVRPATQWMLQQSTPQQAMAAGWAASSNAKLPMQQLQFIAAPAATAPAMVLEQPAQITLSGALRVMAVPVSMVCMPDVLSPCVHLSSVTQQQYQQAQHMPRQFVALPPQQAQWQQLVPTQQQQLWQYQQEQQLQWYQRALQQHQQDVQRLQKHKPLATQQAANQEVCNVQQQQGQQQQQRQQQEDEEQAAMQNLPAEQIDNTQQQQQQQQLQQLQQPPPMRIPSIQNAIAEQLTTLTDMSSSTAWAKHPETGTNMQQRKQWPAPVARSLSFGDQPDVEQRAQKPHCLLECALSDPLPQRCQAQKRQQELVVGRQLGMRSPSQTTQPTPQSTQHKPSGRPRLLAVSGTVEEQDATQQPRTPQPRSPPPRMPSNVEQQPQHEEQQQQEEQQQEFEQQGQQQHQQLHQEGHQQLRQQQQQQEEQQEQQEEQPQQNEHQQPPPQQHQEQQGQPQKPPKPASDTARRIAQFASSAPGTRLDRPLTTPTSSSQAAPAATQPPSSSSQDMAAADNRIILLFDINGVLTKSGTRRHGADADGSRLRPGLEHLRRLLGRFRLGVYVSSAARTVAQVLREVERRLGEQVFEPGLVLHREHTRLASVEQRQASDKPWDTVKPLGIWFWNLNRVLLFDDDTSKAVPGEELNLMPVLCSHEAPYNNGIERLVDCILTVLGALGPQDDVRQHVERLEIMLCASAAVASQGLYLRQEDQLEEHQQKQEQQRQQMRQQLQERRQAEQRQQQEETRQRRLKQHAQQRQVWQQQQQQQVQLAQQAQQELEKK